MPIAVEHFTRAVALGFHDWKHIEEDTDLDNIRDDPGFKKAIEKARKPARDESF